MRNPNSHGTVYKLQGKRRRPWIARVTTGWTPEGKQIRQIIGCFATKTEGMDALALHRVSPVSPKADVTLGKLYEEWSSVKYKYISKATVNNYKASWKYLSKHEGVKFKDLRTAHFQAVIDQCYKNKMSRSTLEKIRSVAIMLYNYALENDIINKNYAKFIKLPKIEKVEKKRFSDIEIKKIEEATGTIS